MIVCRPCLYIYVCIISIYQNFFKISLIYMHTLILIRIEIEFYILVDIPSFSSLCWYQVEYEISKLT